MRRLVNVLDTEHYDSLAYARAERIVSSLAYKKDWTFEPRIDGRILISVRLEDVNAPGQFALASKVITFSENIPDEFVVRIIYEAIKGMEIHEASEWFKVEGRAIFNEHDLYPERFAR